VGSRIVRNRGAHHAANDAHTTVGIEGCTHRGSCSALRPERLYNYGDDVWTTHAILVPAGYPFCPSCPLRGDGGLQTQEKQLGSCGTPALGIVARRVDGSGQAVWEQRNSAETDCGNATMKSLWRVPIPFDRWVKFIRHFRFAPDSSGFVETYVDDDGDNTHNFRPVPASLDGLSKRVERVASPFGGEQGYRIFTWTQKSGSSVDNPSACARYPCSHQRTGVYRNPGVTGTAAVYTDAWAVATGPGAALAAAYAP
jgi:hypothetical protein